MTTFSDDFNRADGLLGANWTTPLNRIRISGARAGDSSANIGTAICLGATNAGAMSASLTLDTTISQSTAAQLFVKSDASATNYYFLTLGGSSGAWLPQVRRFTGNLLLAQGYAPIVLPNPSTLTLTYDQGNIFGYINGTLWVWAKDTLLDTAEYSGFTCSGVAYPITLFSTEGPGAAAFSVSPAYAQAGGGQVLLTLSGVNTSWTPGSPGTPTFSVNAGSLSGQVVGTPSSATVWFTPPADAQDVTITDPSTGLTDSIHVTASGEPPGGGVTLRITEAGAEYINNAPDHDKPVFLHTDMDIGYPNTQYSVGELLYSLFIYLTYQLNGDMTTPLTDPPYNPRLDYIWNAINGGVAQPVGLWSPTTDAPVKIDTENTLAFLKGGANNWADLSEVVGLLGGSPTVLSHQDLKTAIDNIDLSSILTRLEEIQPNHLLSITDLAGLINMLTLNSAYNLGDILTAIGNLNPATAPGLAAALATIMGSLGAIALEIAAVGAAETEDAAASSAGAASAASALAWLLANGPYILDTLADLQALLAASGNAVPQPPVWPGLAHVDLGPPVDLATTNTLAGPMHGVLLDITSADPGTNRYVYDTVPAWKNIGALSFFTDTGHHETYQALSFAQALYVPKSMAVAGGVRVFHGRGPQGTIRPWSYKT